MVCGPFLRVSEFCVQCSNLFRHGLNRRRRRGQSRWSLALLKIAILNRGLLYVLLFGVAQPNAEGTVVGGAAMVYITM